MKIAICNPVDNFWAPGFGIDLARLLLSRHPRKPEICVLQVRGAAHCQARSRLVEDAFKVGASHMLWLDSDMRFPSDTLTRLLGHKKAIIGANYCTRNPPHILTATRNHQLVYTTNKTTGIEVVDTLGFGVLWTSIEVFKKIPAPWFMFEHDGKRYIGEDVYFCRKAKKAGFQIYIDHDLSKQVKHTAALDLPWHMGLSEDELE